MRHFKLVNNSGAELDITTKSILFHEISGLGFEEDNDFRQIGDFWMLNRTGRNQASIGGSVIFTDALDTELGDTPYEKYRNFALFIADAPLTLKYNPFGPIIESTDDTESYFRRTVRVSSLSKSEYTEYGALDCEITFVCYTPWYNIFSDTLAIEAPDTTGDYGWVWGERVVYEDNQAIWHTVESVNPLVFNTTDTYVDDNGVWHITGPSTSENQPKRPKFGYEPDTGFNCEELDASTDCPIKLTIYGPLRDPSWVHSVISADANGNDVEETVSTGGFVQSANVSLETEDDKLVIDGTDGNYKIYQINANGTTVDLYSRRNFSTQCFVNFKRGRNRLIITSSSGDTAKKIDIEGHIYYATV